MGGTATGRVWPWWQLLQVTSVFPSKLFLLISYTILIICRAVCFSFLVSRSYLPFSVTWQKSQCTPSEVRIRCITGNICEAGMPVSTLMVLNTVSAGASGDFGGAGAAAGFGAPGAAWEPAFRT